MKTLKDTIPGMLSQDWKERLVSEIEQVDIRLFSLERHMTKIGEESPEFSLLEAQRDSMTEYLRTLTARANTFGVSYKLPSIGERMKAYQDSVDFQNFDPMFWIIVLFMLNSMKGGEKNG